MTAAEAILVCCGFAAIYFALNLWDAIVEGLTD